MNELEKQLRTAANNVFDVTTMLDLLADKVIRNDFALHQCDRQKDIQFRTMSASCQLERLAAMLDGIADEVQDCYRHYEYMKNGGAKDA